MIADATRVRCKDGRDLVLRSPGAGDGAATLAFVRQLFAESHRNLNHPASYFATTTVEQQQSFVDATASHPRNVVIAAWDGDRVIGNANVGVSTSTFASHVGEIGLGVLGAYAGQGVGRALTERLLEVCAQNGVTNITLRVRTFNEPAVRLYESLSFERVGTLVGVARLSDGEVADEHLYQRVR